MPDPEKAPWVEYADYLMGNYSHSLTHDEDRELPEKKIPFGFQAPTKPKKRKKVK